MLAQAAVYAQPGGPDLGRAYRMLQPYEDDIRAFVSNGGRYLGFCLGAFLAGSTPGFRLLPDGVNATPERREAGAQVTGVEDTIIQVDWTFRSPVGPFATGDTAKSQWMYFQDGAVITGLSAGDNATVLGRYSSNGNVAATLTPFGKGIVALVGPHPEATPDWYRTFNLENPDGIKYDIGHDFLNAAMDPSTSGPSTSGPAKPSPSKESASVRPRGRVTLPNPIGVLVRMARNPSWAWPRLGTL
ncbi:hypothetical protein E4U42_001513 [Claviceps africana]|uniref:Biotin-protein ligase N-terminal domain-containing protein n=1 Tax=Claviceps africana TaxID=83212 RepID=A0A8K0NF48_9HYPO|nr:hypothetical protein E4U42_001513 [Claviceps africana]